MYVITNDPFSLFSSHPGTKQLIRHFQSGSQHRFQLKGLSGSAPAFISASIIKELICPHFFILPGKEEASYFLNDLESLLGEGSALLFPGSYKRSFAPDDTDNSSVLLRTEVLNRLSKGENVIVVTFPEAVFEKVVTKKNLEQNTVTLKAGEKTSIDFITDFLHEYGFEHSDFAMEAGQFSIRGGIVDIFSFANEFPYRIEIAGDTVESIRSFHPISQLSFEKQEQITIIPNVSHVTAFNENRENIFDFIPGHTVLWIKDYEQALNTIREEYDNIPGDKKGNLFVDANQVKAAVDKFSVIESGTRFHYTDGSLIEYRTSPQPSFNKNFDLLSENLYQHLKEGYKNIIFTDSARQSERLYAIFSDLPHLPPAPAGRESVPFETQMLSVHEGFVFHDLKLVCYTDHQVFNRYHRYRLKEKFSKDKAITIKELTGLKPGDFVTHIDHGIGKFAGLEKIEVNGKFQEALRLLYRDNDILYVSIHSLHRISKYSGKDGAIPSLNKLGSATWQNLKQKTKSRVKDIAKDLIALYAKRKAADGFAFSPDTYLQNELEASFLYEDTPDQVKATRDVKKDLEKSYPMDRLICGDVGFGKTEIAIRAAFKAVTDGKQVAVLVPTTILALQHYNTFKERLKDFPCTIDYISRFKSQKQQSETIQKLIDGKIDIIIGTHRLLGKEIKFKDLGLLVVDEEQKFGVAAKEKLKALRINVDTLTLTATPIPRTLQFSLMGARDLSIINTPPPNRYPITTEVHDFNEAVIREAINYEVSRGGQVFFIHNRVKDIQEVVLMIRKLCPKVSIAVGHGQMDGAHLEEIMLGFIDGEYDVLVSTTIVESGLDIPNANTMIINHAEYFGLSDLHQLRGRVGRSNKKAFCYLLAPPLSVLTPEAKQRLKALEEFSELGSGFNISLRDLDIRGAGNLLGGEQSGFISDIGFEMYHKILDEAMQELKESDFKSLFAKEGAEDEGRGTGEKGSSANIHQTRPPSPAPRPFSKECQIDTDLEILIPDSYVNSIAERLNLYKVINDIEEAEDLVAYEKNLTDRFGPVPKQVKELISTIRLRWTARSLGFEKIILRNQKLMGHFIQKKDSPYFQSDVFTHLLQFVQSHHKICRMREEKGKLTLIYTGVPGVEKANEVLEMMAKKDVSIEI